MRSFPRLLMRYHALRRIHETPVNQRSWWDRLTFDLRAGAFLTRVSKRYSAFIPINCDLGPSTTFIHEFDGLHIAGGVSIGARCTIAHNVTIGKLMPTADAASPQIGCDVFIGAGAVILGDTRIGDGARIGAGVVLVDASIPAGATVVNRSAFVLPDQVPAYPTYKTHSGVSA